MSIQKICYYWCVNGEKILVWHYSHMVWVKITNHVHGVSKNSNPLRFIRGKSFKSSCINNKIIHIVSVFFLNLHLTKMVPGGSSAPCQGKISTFIRENLLQLKFFTVSLTFAVYFSEKI